MLPSLAALSNGGPSPKKQRRLDLKVSRSSSKIGSTDQLSVGCVSAAEMIIAKLTLDAIVKSNKSNTTVHEALQETYREELYPVLYVLSKFRDQIKEAFSADPSDRDLDRWNSLLNLYIAYKRDIDEAVANKYVSFLLGYIGERGITMDELFTKISEEEEESDDEEDGSDRNYSPGVSRILMEFFTRPTTYATGRWWTDAVRALVDEGDDPCVAIVMMSFREDPYDNTGYLIDINRVTQDKPRTFLIQGIVACPIYKQLRHISVGTTFLSYFEQLSEESDRYIVAHPVGNEGWQRKLEMSPRVLLSGRK
tara:strand:+ start:70 stop:996 length:927 start_codon:yes stop_codon:yes gene_type:complete